MEVTLSIDGDKTEAHTYVLSDDPIKKGDWCLCKADYTESGWNVSQINNTMAVKLFNTRGHPLNENKKIIASTDKSLTNIIHL